MSNEALEKRINKEWSVPNRYEGFPEPLLVELTSRWNPNWTYTRALCPVNGCKYEGLKHGFNKHYARTHAPEQWRQRAKRVIKAVAS